MSIKQKVFIFLFLAILSLHTFTRFYEFTKRADFGWDQVDNAWATYNILVKKQYPLVGMEGKLNSGIFIGPLYYYFITSFYYFSNHDPIVSPLIAGITSLLGLVTLFYVTKKILNTETALIAIFINAVSILIIQADRVQWPVNFIALISYWIFYFLYKVLCGSPKYVLPLAIATGLAFHIHFTAVFFPILIIITLPFFPKTKETLKYIIFSLPVFLLFLLPTFIYNIQSKNSASINISNYINVYYHGFHLRRLLQLAHDGFIKFESILNIRILRPFVFIYYPLCIILLIKSKAEKHKIILSALMGIWILIPWVVFTLYSGELSDYYFNSTLFIAMAIIAYLTFRLLSVKFWPIKLMTISFWVYFAVININTFLIPRMGNLTGTKISAQNAINEGRVVKYGRGNAEAYMYEYMKLLESKR